MTVYLEPICMNCAHFFFDKKGRKCKAFPLEIPNEIWIGDNKHTEPLPSQVDKTILFKKR